MGYSNDLADFAPSASAGAILQVRQTVLTLNSVASNNQAYNDITGYNCSITPSSTSNKILVQINGNFGGYTNDVIALLLLRGSTAIFQGDADGDRTRASASARFLSEYDTVPISFSYLDSPEVEDTSVTYKLQYQTVEPETLRRP